MGVPTVFGFYWIKASTPEIIMVLVFILFMAGVYALLRYNQFLKNKKIQDESLFLFKMKRLGLSNFQIKLINNLIRTLNLSNPNQLLENSALFEQAIGDFLRFLKKKGESMESLSEICKDITITYERVYSPALYKKPLESMNQVEINQLMYFTTMDGTVYLGKIVTRTADSLSIKLFRIQKELKGLGFEQQVTAYIWRIGDAEYIFTSKTMGLNNNILTISMPESFTRDKEFRHPFLETIIPITIRKADPGPLDEQEEVPGTLFKINDFEAVIRAGSRFDYNHSYIISFDAMDFKFIITARIIANKTIEEGNIFYYTMKFVEMSEAARAILKRYMYEHL